jgi:carboxymethylenebutenolidase
MDQKIIDLFNEFTHTAMPRRQFMERLATLAGGTAAAYSALSLLDPGYAKAETVAANDPRIEGQRVTFKGASGDVKAYLVQPKSGGKQPGVLVIHENRGLTPHIQDITRRITVDTGFTALGIDLLSPQGGTPEPFDDDKAAQLHAKLDTKVAIQDLVAATDYLSKLPTATGKVGCIGFCFGGGMVNLLVQEAPAPLVAGVAFYGPIPPLDNVSKIKAKLLLNYGGEDHNITDKYPGYDDALKKASVQHEAYIYEGAQHAFNNDTSPARYNADAAKLAWSRSVEFFKKNLA